jgi:hypothetical protein
MQPRALAADKLGNLYIADASNFVVRKVATNGIITTVAGTGVSGITGDGGSANSARLASPTGIALDAFGNLYIADFQIRKVDTNGIITTWANTPAHAIASDSVGNLYVASSGLVQRIGDAPVLTLSNISAGDAGSYSAIVTGPSGIVSSTVAQLSVVMSPSLEVTLAPPAFSGSVVWLTWNNLNALPPLSYQLQYSTNLLSSMWSDLGDPVRGSAPQLSVTNSAGADPRRFYRIRIEP